MGDVARRRQTSYDVARLRLMSPMDLWRNSIPFFGAAAFCTTKIDNFRAPRMYPARAYTTLVVLVFLSFNYFLTYFTKCIHIIPSGWIILRYSYMWFDLLLQNRQAACMIYAMEIYIWQLFCVLITKRTNSFNSSSCVFSKVLQL